MKKLAVALVVVVLIVIGVLALGDNKKSSDNQNQTRSGQNSQQPSKTNNGTNSQQPTNPVQTNTVTIKDMAFSPANITVKKGTTVTWTNQDSTSHTVTETDGKTGPNSQPLDQGQSFTFTYNQTGTFNYHCSIHSEMTGSVTVTP